MFLKEIVEIILLLIIISIKKCKGRKNSDKFFGNIMMIFSQESSSNTYSYQNSFLQLTILLYTIKRDNVT